MRSAFSSKLSTSLGAERLRHWQLIPSTKGSNESEKQSSCRDLRGLTRVTPRTLASSSGLVGAVIR